MADFTIKRGDTRPALEATLKDNNYPVDLTDATAVKLFMRETVSQTVTTNAACTFVNRTAGQIAYAWVSGDTDEVGVFEVEFQITWSDGGIETVPNDVPEGHDAPYYTVEVTQDLAT